MSLELDFDVEPEDVETTNKARAVWEGEVPAVILKRVEDAIASRLRKRIALKSQSVHERTQWDALYRAALLQVVPNGSLEINPRDEVVDGALVAYTFKVVPKRKPSVRKPKVAPAE